MAIGGFNVELNGVKYNLAEDAEGQHYQLAGEPLRPPNAVTVQGEDRQKFQMRPDTLLWTLTDWAGGEGQQKYDFRAPNRWRELTGVRAFETPGKLKAGFYVEDTKDSGGVSDLAIDGLLGIGKSNLYLFDYDTNAAYAWDSANGRWGAASTLTGPTNGARRQICGDANYLYWQENGTTEVWRWDGTTASTITTTLVDDSDSYLAELGGYVYAVSVKEGKVWEMSKTPTTITEIDDFSDEPGSAQNSAIVPMDGKLYVLVTDTASSRIREITPTTAAGTGFGAEIARLQGFKARSIWAHSGTLYVSGEYGNTQWTIMYVQPDGTYGTLGEMRPGDSLLEIAAATDGASMLEHYAVLEQIDASRDEQAVVQIDAVSGGYALLAINEDGDEADGQIYSVAEFEGDIFFSTKDDAAVRRTMRARRDQYTKASEAISPWHDFDLAEKKILASVVLSMEDLPADWQVRVDYALDGVDTWVNVIDNTTTNSNGETAVVSTDTSSIQFGTLSIRVRLDYTGGGVPTTTPVILGVDVRAVVAQPVPVWRLLINLSDDKSGAQGHSGARKLTNIKTAADLKQVISFKDGYQDRTPGVFVEYDVVIDKYTFDLSLPGEGVAAVVLKEIV